ncbi:MAG: PHP domain-containing protein [Candidatus Pacebacteria bacterium]|nr:PHP domain-containing protein [Candidatus Paceibacterota bacterium]
MIDLHTHSTASDGTCTPTEIVTRSQHLKLTAVALTDHDTVRGCSEFMEAGGHSSTLTIPGVEIACSWYQTSIHIVGLFIKPDTPELASMLKRIRAARDNRNTELLQRLKNLGLQVSPEELQAAAGGGVPGRPHIARVLVSKGYCSTLRDAFNKYIGRTSPAYVRRYLPLPAEGIATIKRAAGVTVWAHPLGGQTTANAARIRQVAKQLKSQGLDGMEVRYCDYTPHQVNIAEKIAGELDLLRSGGSDFHGVNMAGVKLGKGYGDLNVPDDFLQPLQERAARYAH